MSIDLHAAALGLGIMLTAVSQLLLRRGATRGNHWLAGYINPSSAAGYASFVLVALLNVYALQTIHLKTLTAWTSLNYVLTLVLAHWLLGEPLNAKMLAGCGLIVGGIVVFSL